KAVVPVAVVVMVIKVEMGLLVSILPLRVEKEEKDGPVRMVVTAVAAAMAVMVSKGKMAVRGLMVAMV
ncbi:MAG: hypothetical protein VX075_16825, partial [Pseudomonadota bacterium]|nr:hypothetical protein [Pseudomonadota bacterium]